MDFTGELIIILDKLLLFFLIVKILIMLIISIKTVNGTVLYKDILYKNISKIYRYVLHRKMGFLSILTTNKIF